MVESNTMSELTIECEHTDISNLYIGTSKNYHSDSGFDLYCPCDIVVPEMSIGFKINLQIKVMLRDKDGTNKPFMLCPRSSMGAKTPLRLSNSIGIIDKDYRGDIIGIVDNISNKSFAIQKYDRLFQIVPFHGNGVSNVVLGTVSETTRGELGIGSTGR